MQSLCVFISLQFLLLFHVRALEIGKPPNVIIMLMDDMGWGDLGCNGEPNKETPFIDALAAGGMTVSSLYTSNPLCSPSRASLLTGRLPIRNGFYSNNTVGRNAYTPQEIVGGISKSEILLPEILKQKKYTNALIGKWHLGHREEYLPLNRGFDYYFGAPNCHFGPYNDVDTPNIPVFRNQKMVGRYFEEFLINRSTGESNMTNLFTKEAVKFVHRMAEKEDPFFLLWAPDAAHAPTYASRKFLGKSRRGKYGDAVMELDAGVGEIVAALEETDQANNTLIVFTSDNGAALVSKFEGGSSGPFLCGKQTTFEGGMRAPGIFYWPGTIQPGTLSHQVWTQMDLFPTILKLANISMSQDVAMDGISLTQNLRHPRMEFQRNVFFYRGNRLMAVRRGAYKMHLWTWNTTPEELARGIDFCPGQRTAHVTTSKPFDHRDQPLLFNIEVDPGEKYAISPNSKVYKKAVKKLMTVVNQHEREMVPGEPQLNWCDKSVMHWSPPGCKEINKCLPIPESKPYLCKWPH